MSDNFGESKLAGSPQLPKDKDLKAMYPDHAHMANAQYNRLLKDYFACVTKYLNDFYAPEMLEQQLNRRDLDTVCAYELYQMKKEFTTTNVLNTSNFVPRQ